MKNLLFVAVLTITSAFFISACTQEKPEASYSKPNIIYIMSDDHAQRAISAYSRELINTPNIDRIANEGMIFRNSFVTNSLCAPSRAALLTGKYSSQNGLRDNRDEFDGSQQTFIKLLRNSGYQTSIIGKWHLKTKPQGFDHWRILINQGTYYNPKFIENGDTTRYTGYTTDIITKFAIEELQKRDKAHPFVMLVHHKAPHRNWMPEPDHFGAFDSKEIPLPETFYDDYKTRKAAAEADMRVADMYISFDLKLNEGSYDKETGTGGNANFAKNAPGNWMNTLNSLTGKQRKAWDSYYDKINEDFKEHHLSGKALLKWKYERYMHDYLSCILSVDESVGEILDYLDEHGLTENTIVVYTSDQGFYLGEHGWFDKRWMYEESFRTPLLIRYPKSIKAGSVCDNFVMNIDYAPTFFDFASLNIPGDIQGESLKPLLKGQTPPSWRKSMYYHYYEYPHGWHNVHKHYGIRTDRYKLIYFYDMDYWELFDLEKDVHEMNNIYEEMKNSPLVDSLKKELTALKIKYKDSGE